ncbi:hypothetical protein BDZ90DRAFT_164977 [Jaminaea rosea]|uniref:Uncharacterized protein n=1 Tax=Jaminaea rosea TaxID=1569628 RepID=A0A316USD0_9BASI|nr:hypothetical protein BDZ90DRAFT_164977 [Jaminaea rosea]PWN28196.1 hypothetical protein BDZ90DRAFT_164977 [Jaminaea rosea]
MTLSPLVPLIRTPSTPSPLVWCRAAPFSPSPLPQSAGSWLHGRKFCFICPAAVRRRAVPRVSVRVCSLRDVAFGFASLLAASLSAAAVLCRCSMGYQAQAGRLVSQYDEGARSFVGESAMIAAMVNAMLSGHARWL